MVKISNYLTPKIHALSKGRIFMARELANMDYAINTVGRVLSRMVRSGKIARYSKGKFYIPQETIFGKLGPNEQEVMKDLFVNDSKYIGCKTPHRRIKHGYFTIAFIKQNNDITASNIPLLQILDAIRHINRIPNANEKESLRRLAAILKQLSDLQIEEIISLSYKYNSATQRVLKNLVAERNRTMV